MKGQPDKSAVSLPSEAKLEVKSLGRNVHVRKCGLGQRLRLSRLMVGWVAGGPKDEAPSKTQERQMKALEDTYAEVLGLGTDVTEAEREKLEPMELIALSALIAKLNGFNATEEDVRGKEGSGENPPPGKAPGGSSES